jgi:hypothetical protein
MSTAASADLSHIHSLINDYYKQKPDYTQHIPSSKTPPKTSTDNEEPTTTRTKDDIERQFFFGLLPRENKSQTVDMPVHPREEETTGGSKYT